MLLLAHLLKQNPEWRHHEIRVLRVVTNEDAMPEVRQHIVELNAAARISAEPVVVMFDNHVQAIHNQSEFAAVVVPGLEVPCEGGEAEFFQRMESLSGSLLRVLFVSSVGGMELES